MVTKRRLLLLLPLLLLALTPSSARAGAVFDDSGSALHLSTSTYDLTLSKTNGAILTLVDRRSNASLTGGSNGGCLWDSVFDNPGGDAYVGGCSYGGANSNPFSCS
ncbi:MAG: hypothetical protein ACR2PL_26325 [Dehalococcoidia bacterium]